MTSCLGMVEPAGVGTGVKGTWIPIEAFFFPFDNTEGYEVEPGVIVRNMSVVFDDPSEGIVVGKYQVVQDGAGQPLKRYAGTFKYLGDDKKGGAVMVTAFGVSAEGTLVKGGVGQFDNIVVNQVIQYTNRQGEKKTRPIVLKLRR